MVKSKFGDYFNHDEDAPLYDRDVQNEENPVRTGYRAVLDWIGSLVTPGKDIIDLGCGTGNTILALPPMNIIHAVDISRNMLAVAKKKLDSLPHIIYARKDLLTFCAEFHGTVDYVVSTYAIHHLLPEEKLLLFSLIYNILADQGEFICGDLMWRDKKLREAMFEKYPELAEDFDDEFYWNIENDGAALRSLGYHIEFKQFSDLSRGLRARKNI